MSAKSKVGIVVLGVLGCVPFLLYAQGQTEDQLSPPRITVLESGDLRISGDVIFEFPEIEGSINAEGVQVAPQLDIPNATVMRFDGGAYFDVSSFRISAEAGTISSADRTIRMSSVRISRAPAQ